MVKWHKITEETPDIENVIFGKWYVDNCGGYHGESRWFWFASGDYIDGLCWIDINDEEREWRGAGYDKPTHYCLAPDWGKP